MPDGDSYPLCRFALPSLTLPSLAHNAKAASPR